MQEDLPPWCPRIRELCELGLYQLFFFLYPRPNCRLSSTSGTTGFSFRKKGKMAQDLELFRPLGFYDSVCLAGRLCGGPPVPIAAHIHYCPLTAKRDFLCFASHFISALIVLRKGAGQGRAYTAAHYLAVHMNIKETSLSLLYLKRLLTAKDQSVTWPRRKGEEK